MAQAPPTPAFGLPSSRRPRHRAGSTSTRRPGRRRSRERGAHRVRDARPRRRRRLSLLAYVDECASCGEPLAAGQLADGLLRCPSCEVEFDLPRAGRAAGGERPLSCAPSPSSRTRRAAGWPLTTSSRAQAVARMRGLAQSGATRLPRRADRPPNDATSCPTPPSPTTIATCCTSSIGGSSARVRPAGRCAPATPSTGRRGCARSGSRTSGAIETWAAFQIPIGLAFFMRSTITQTVVAFYPSPAGATESNWRSGMGGARGGQPGAQARDRCRGACRQPDVGSGAVRDRPDRPVLRARGADQVTVGGSPARSALQTAVPEFFAGLRARAVAQ